MAVRVRPLNNKELSQSEFETIRVLDQKMIVLLDPGNEFESDDVKNLDSNLSNGIHTFFQASKHFLIYFFFLSSYARIEIKKLNLLLISPLTKVLVKFLFTISQHLF